MITLKPRRTAIGTYDIYSVQCEEVNAITRECIDFTNYETIAMGPAIPEPGASRSN